MNRNISPNQSLDSAYYQELSDREAASLLGGSSRVSQHIDSFQAVPSPVVALVLLFANPFAP